MCYAHYPFAKCSSVEDYYLKNCNRHWFDKISIPTLSLNALDDNFVYNE